MGFATDAIHAGQGPDSATGAVTVPIYPTSTYAQEGLDNSNVFEDARTSNPSLLAMERNLAALEGAQFGYAFASGMAAIDATLRLIKGGEHVIVSDNTYGGTFRLFDRILSNYGIQFSFVDTSDVHNVEAAIKDNTRMVWIETPSNPLLKIIDLEAIAKIAREHKILSVSDNTFATPWI
jgi:cystathionine beta-lyase/cystathionine gamma-synthase